MFISVKPSFTIMKDIEQEKGPFLLKSKVDYAVGAIVKLPIVKKDSGSIILFAFDAGQQLSEHVAPFGAVIQIVEGKIEFRLEEVVYEMGEGDALIIPAKVPHAVHAVVRTKMR